MYKEVQENIEEDIIISSEEQKKNITNLFKKETPIEMKYRNILKTMLSNLVLHLPLKESNILVEYLLELRIKD